MDSDSYIPQYWKAQYITGLKKLVSKIVESTSIILPETEILGSHNTIAWIEETTKKIRERIYGQNIPVGEGSIHAIFLEALGEAFKSVIRVEGTDRARIADARVLLQIAGVEALLLDGEGNSNYIQSPTSQRWRLIAGVIQSNGEIISGEKFTVTHPEPGVYKLKFTSAFNHTPSVTGNDVQGTQRTFSYEVLSAKEIIIIMSNGTGAREDIAFSFHAIG